MAQYVQQEDPRRLYTDRVKSHVRACMSAEDGGGQMRNLAASDWDLRLACFHRVSAYVDRSRLCVCPDATSRIFRDYLHISCPGPEVIVFEYGNRDIYKNEHRSLPQWRQETGKDRS